MVNKGNNKYQPLDTYTSRKPKSRRMRWLIILFILMIITVVVYFLFQAKLDNIEQNYSFIYNEINSVELISPKNDLSNYLNESKPVSLLLVGTNFSQSGRLGDEELMVTNVITLAPNGKNSYIVKLPSQLVISQEQTISQVSIDKNQAEFRQDLSDLISQPISRTIEVRLANIRPIIEELGTITVSFDHDVMLDGSNYPANTDIELSGRQVEYLLGQVDSSTPNQQSNRSSQIILGLVKGLVEYDNLTKIDTILEKSQGAIVTDLSFSEVKSLIQKRYLSANGLETFEAMDFSDYCEHDGDKLRINQDDLKRARDNINSSIQALVAGQ